MDWIYSKLALKALNWCCGCPPFSMQIYPPKKRPVAGQNSPGSRVESNQEKILGKQANSQIPIFSGGSKTDQWNPSYVSRDSLFNQRESEESKENSCILILRLASMLPSFSSHASVFCFYSTLRFYTVICEIKEETLKCHNCHTSFFVFHSNFGEQKEKDLTYLQVSSHNGEAMAASFRPE